MPLRYEIGDGLDALNANRLDNLLTVCRGCHTRWEGIPLRPISRGVDK